MRNRTRISSLDAFGLRDQRDRIYPALEASDGSTLSLDFTAMSSLDSRLTFSRSSTATFINSSGLVKYADHNLAVNSAWTDSNTPPTSWSIFNSTTPNAVISIPQSGRRQITVTSGVQSFLWQAQTVSAGLAHTLSVVVHSVTGTGPTAGNLLAMNGAVAPPGAAGILYYKDGVLANAVSEVTPGVWSMVFSGGTQIRLIQGSNVSTSTYTIVISSPQLQVGAVPLPAFVPNSSTSVAYHAPRFDHDPTTLAPRGLLIEGSATNLLCYSESFATSGGSTNWGYNGNTGAVVSTSNPAGGSTAFQFAETANSGPLQQSVTVTNAVHTFSAWFKGSTYSGTTTTQVQFGLFVTAFVAGTVTKISGPGSVSVAANIVTLSGLSTSEWTRVQFTTTSALSAGSVAILIYPNSTSLQTNASFYIWGAQLETGSSASSYIPTETSTVQRAADDLQLTGSNFSSIWPSGLSEWSVYWSGDITRTPATTQFVWLARAVGSSRTRGFITTGSSIRSSNNLADLTPGLNAAVNTVFKMATGFKNADCFMWAHNGTTTASASETSSGLQTDSDRLLFNVNADNFMHIRQFKFWQSRLSNGTLQGLVS